MASKIIEEDIEDIAKNIEKECRKLSGKTLLITGGAGFLGNYLISVIDYLNKNVLEKPCRIISVDNFITGVKYRIEESPNFKPIRHNIKDPLEINEKIDFCVEVFIVYKNKVLLNDYLHRYHQVMHYLGLYLLVQVSLHH